MLLVLTSWIKVSQLIKSPPPSPLYGTRNLATMSTMSHQFSSLHTFSLWCLKNPAPSFHLLLCHSSGLLFRASDQNFLRISHRCPACCLSHPLLLFHFPVFFSPHFSNTANLYIILYGEIRCACQCKAEDKIIVLHKNILLLVWCTCSEKFQTNFGIDFSVKTISSSLSSIFLYKV